MRFRPLPFALSALSLIAVQSWASESRAEGLIEFGAGAMGAYGASFLPKPGTKELLVNGNPQPVAGDGGYPGFSGPTSGFGFFVDLRLIKFLGLEVDFIKQRSKASGDYTITSNGQKFDYAIDIAHDAWHIPVLAKGVLPMPLLAPYVFAGIDFVSVSNPTAAYTPKGSSPAGPTLEGFANNYKMWTFGFGAEIKLPIPSIDLRIPISLRGSYNPAASDKLVDRVKSRQVTTTSGATGVEITGYSSEFMWQALGTVGVGLYFLSVVARPPLLACLALGASISLAPALAPAAKPAVTFARGAACAREADGSCAALAPGAEVSGQRPVVAGKGGLVLTLADGMTVEAEEATELRLLPATVLQLGVREDTRAIVLQMSRGRVAVTTRSAQPTKSALLVRGPHTLSAIVRSGAAMVRATEDSLLVAAQTGASLIAAGNDWNDVPAGTVRSLRHGETKPASRKLLDAPVAQAKRVLSLAIAGKSPPLAFAFAPLLGSARYEAVLRRDGADVETRQIAKAAEDVQVSFADLPPGTYAMAVRAVDQDGIESPWSGVIEGAVVGLELPPGATIVGDTVELAPKQRIRIRASDGVEAAMSDGTSFGPVPADLGMLTDRPQTLRFRRRGATAATAATDELRVRLSPRTLRATVDIRPKTATWPSDPVTITITLADARGPAPADLSVVTKATLDLEPIEIAWTRDGGTLRATVPPRATAKPRVLRVEVFDGHDQPLGRGFLEIARGDAR